MVSISVNESANIHNKIDPLPIIVIIVYVYDRFESGTLVTKIFYLRHSLVVKLEPGFIPE